MRKIQCPNCPWKTTTTAIPGGSCPTKDEKLNRFSLSGQDLCSSNIAIMQCHESEDANPDYCVGWVVNQLTIGNNLSLRLLGMDGRFKDMKTVGPQRESIIGITYAPLKQGVAEEREE